MASNIIKRGDDPAKINRLLEWVDKSVTAGMKTGDVQVSIDRPERSLDQNRKGWAMFRDFEPIEFNGRRWNSEAWKCFLASAFNQEMPAVGLMGEPVTIGTSTSRMTKERYREFIEFIYAAGSERGVRWSEPALSHYNEIVNLERVK